MFFSIIVPVYNVEAYVGCCLDSIVGQEFDSFEVIAVDDGSTDNSGTVCDTYGESYANVQVIHQENRGLAGARNAGLAVAKGEWILFVDSDDWIAEGMLQKLALQIKEEKAELYCYNACKTDERGAITEKMVFHPENGSIAFLTEQRKFEYITKQFMKYQDGWEVWSRAFRRDIIEQNGLCFQNCSDVFAEDYLFTFQYLLYTKKIKRLCGMFYYYRQRNGSLINNVNKQDVLRRLYRLAEVSYGSVKKERLGYFKKNYHRVYFELLNHHLQYMLSEVSPEQLEAEWKELRKKRLHRRWMRQLERQKSELQKDMRTVKWL